MTSDVAVAALDGPTGTWARDHLATDIVGWLTTRAPDGRLQSSVISFLWDAGEILFYSRPGTPKLRNIEADPHVAFHLLGDAYGDHGASIEGLARVDPDVAPSDVHPVYRAKYLAPLGHWGMDEGRTARDFSVAIVIRPTRVRVW